MRRLVIFALVSGIFLSLGITLGYYYAQPNSQLLLSPFVPKPTEPERVDYSEYSIESLRSRTYETPTIQLKELIESQPSFNTYIFTFSSLGRTMSGVINVPKSSPSGVILMLRGYVPTEIYSPGVGTKNAAAYYAESGFITVAPDFFGYGTSDPEPDDSWIARFEKPIPVIELYNALLVTNFSKLSPNQELERTSEALPVGIWGHSNGGQIALTVLEILKDPVPTTLWAPVTAPFPYSILFFSDEHDDEGRAMRIWISQLEKNNDLREFSISSNLKYLQGPFVIHHGTADEAALKTWSDEFLDKVELENERRKELRSTPTNNAELPLGDPIKFTYYTYEGADHNLQPGWDKVVARDVVFFRDSFR